MEAPKKAAMAKWREGGIDDGGSIMDVVCVCVREKSEVKKMKMVKMKNE